MFVLARQHIESYTANPKNDNLHMLIESHRYIIQVSKHWLMLSFTGRSKQMFGRAHSVDLLPLEPTQCQFVMYSRALELRNTFHDVECKVYINYTCKSTSHKGLQAMNQFSCLRIFHISNYLHVVVIYNQHVAQKMMLKFCHIIWRYLKLLKLSGCATNWLVELPKHLAGVQLYKVLISIGQARFL